MARRHTRRARRASTSVAGAMPDVIVATAMPEAQLLRFVHVVDTVPNPYGEVTVRGEIRQHKACRRLAHYQSLYRAKVIDQPTYAVLDWYAGRLAVAYSGLFRSSLAVSGLAGGSVFSHVPATAASLQARVEVAWALSFVPPDLHAVLNAVMLEDATFETLGPRFYPDLSAERSRRKVAERFRAAAAALLVGVGPRLNLTFAA